MRARFLEGCMVLSVACEFSRRAAPRTAQANDPRQQGAGGVHTHPPSSWRCELWKLMLHSFLSAVFVIPNIDLVSRI